MSIRFKSLGSGSAGNATLIEAREGISVSRLLVDCGMPQRQLTARLQQAGVEPEQLSGIFITHEHSDHIGCASGFAARHRIPVWMSRGTHAAVGQPESLSELIRFARDGEPIHLEPTDFRFEWHPSANGQLRSQSDIHCPMVTVHRRADDGCRDHHCQGSAVSQMLVHRKIRGKNRNQKNSAADSEQTAQNSDAETGSDIFPRFFHDKKVGSFRNHLFPSGTRND